MNNKITMGLVGAAIAAMAIAPTFMDKNEKTIPVSKKSDDNKDSEKVALSEEAMKEYKNQIESLLDKKTNSMTLSENISALTDSYSMEESETIAETIYRELNLAQSADSTNYRPNGFNRDKWKPPVAHCHVACHGACHKACHGARGWR